MKYNQQRDTQAHLSPFRSQIIKNRNYKQNSKTPSIFYPTLAYFTCTIERYNKTTNRKQK